MAITDLTGTSWLLTAAGIEAAQSAYGDIQIRIEYTSNNIFYPQLRCYENSGETYVLYGGTEIYSTTDGFLDAAYALIENIRSGADVSSSAAIAWFETAGTLQPVPLLTTDQELTSIADAIRARGGYPASNTLEYPAGFIDGIENIPYNQPEVFGTITASHNSSTFTTIGSDNSKAHIVVNDRNFFEYNQGVFTCKKAGTYGIWVYARGAYASQGTAIYCYWRFYKNNTIVASYTSGNTYNNAGNTTAFVVTLTEGDTFYGQVRNSTGVTSVTLSYIIY